MNRHATALSGSYSDHSFWAKLGRWAGKAGREVVEVALQLYYTLQVPSTPLWAKTVIIGALAYFISPMDAIPDFLPVIGYTDDLGVLIAAVAAVGLCITDETKAKTAEQAGVWFD